MNHREPLILITGATGTTGKLVVNELARRSGVRVRAGVRSISFEAFARDYGHLLRRGKDGP